MKAGEIYADSAQLDIYDAEYLGSLGFSGCIPYVGLGGGSDLPHKRLTASRYRDYRAHGFNVPAVFVELGTDDADGGYAAGQANARVAYEDLRQLGVDFENIFVIACNDKTAYNNMDLAYVAGFQSFWGDQTGVYGFSNFLNAVYHYGIDIRYFHQCGIDPVRAGTDSFVNVWQDNTQMLGGCDINRVQIGVVVTDPLDEIISRPGGRPDITLRQFVAAADDVTDQTRAMAHADAQAILSAVSGSFHQVTLSDAQVTNLAVQMVNEIFRRLNP